MQEGDGAFAEQGEEFDERAEEQDGSKGASWPRTANLKYLILELCHSNPSRTTA